MHDVCLVNKLCLQKILKILPRLSSLARGLGARREELNVSLNLLFYPGEAFGEDESY